MADPTYLPTGKLPNEVLGALLARYVRSGERVVLGPGVGRDAAVIDMGDRYLVAKTDPITFATDEIGWYLVNVNANDIATTGATPRWLLCTALFPAGRTEASLVESVFAQLSDACASLGIALCGGHTEVTHGLDHVVLVGQMLGEVAPDRLVTPEGLVPGDALLLTKGIAIEGTALMAREKSAELEGLIPAAVVARAEGYLHDPGISVVRDAQVAGSVARLHAMHDPTEGGVATAVTELATASHVGIRVRAASIRVLPETALLCRHFGLNPIGTLASGALLIGCARDDAESIVAALAAAGIWAGVIGEVFAGSGAWLEDESGSVVPMPTFAPDEVARLFA
ncbi:MAG: AIR synthase-related protein [Anaerolineae bacterium]